MAGNSTGEPTAPEIRTPSPAIDSLRVKSSFGRRFLNAAIAALTFVLVCAGLNAFLPFPEIDVVASDLRFFKEHQDDFNTVFIGSSRIHHQISPAIFDRIMRETGHPTRTFNFGINGMLRPESGYVLERLLRTKPSHLKWVFIELDELEVRRFPGKEASRRSLYWHDWKRTSLVLQKLLDAGGDGDGHTSPEKFCEIVTPGQGKSEARDLLFFHRALFARNFTNVGRKIDLAWWTSHLGKKAEITRGLGPGHGRRWLCSSSKQMTAAEAALTRPNWIVRLPKGESRFVSASTEQAYRQMAEEVRKVGATPIFLITPAVSQIKLGFRPESGIEGPVMLFNDATAYPQLYRNEMRVDADHLNGPGAEEFTRLLAQNFAQLISENRIQ